MHAMNTRPHRWATGPDPELRRKFQVWGQSRNQARWRGEPWELTLDQFIDIWGADWHLRGRCRGSMCMTRRDPALPWRADNTELVTRECHAQRQADSRVRQRNQRGQLIAS
jgi:hypothetical protein